MSSSFLSAVALRHVDAGFRIEQRPLLGRVMLATRIFEIGDIVLREYPSMSWQHGSVDELLPRFLGAGASAQAAILDMAMPPISSDLDLIADEASRERVRGERMRRAGERRAVAEVVAQEYEGSPRIIELVEALLLIADCNAHAFEDRIGLFPIAAKANHSCDPSCAHSTKVGGEMRFYASRVLRPGDDITISYLDGLWSSDESLRRERLLLLKLFLCRCSRCMSETAREREAQVGHRFTAEASSHTSVATTPAIVLELAYMECAAGGCRYFHAAGECAHGQLYTRGGDSLDASDVDVGVRTEYPPNAELTGEAITAFLACCKPGAAPTTARLARWVAQRYLRWATLLFGEQDRAVQAMARACANAPRCVVCVNAAAAAV